MKTVDVIECRRCNGSYFAGKHKITLNPAEGSTLPDELYFSIRKVGVCPGCKEQADRTRGGRRKKFDR